MARTQETVFQQWPKFRCPDILAKCQKATPHKSELALPPCFDFICMFDPSPNTKAQKNTKGTNHEKDSSLDRNASTSSCSLKG